jgi:hypothetical protein
MQDMKSIYNKQIKGYLLFVNEQKLVEVKNKIN